jgi:predicted transcriptional regulator
MSETTIGVKLDETTRQRLKALGELRNRSPHWLMKVAIEDYLEREERYEREKREDMEEWENYLRTGDSIPQERVLAWLNEMVEQGKYVAWRE